MTRRGCAGIPDLRDGGGASTGAYGLTLEHERFARRFARSWQVRLKADAFVPQHGASVAERSLSESSFAWLFSHSSFPQKLSCREG